MQKNNSTIFYRLLFFLTMFLLPFMASGCQSCQEKSGSSSDLARCTGNIFRPEETDNDIKDLVDDIDNIESPAEVSISEEGTEFDVFKTEVTNKQFASFLREKNTKESEKDDGETNDCNLDDDESALCYQFNGGGSDGEAESRINSDYSVDSGHDDHPVNYVSWYAADAYCKVLDKRLPTAAEWKLIAKGNNSDVYPWGSSADCASVNAKVNDGDFCSDKGITSANGAKGVANHDDGDVLHISGNVAEWVSDKVGDDDDDDETEDKDKKRLAKGGSWDSNADSLKIEASGRELTPSATDHNIGFRCVSD